MGNLEFKQAIDIPRNFSGILVKALDYTAKINASTKVFNQELKTYLEEPCHEAFYDGSIEFNEVHENLPCFDSVMRSVIRDERLTKVKRLIRDSLPQLYEGSKPTDMASILLEFYYSGRLTNSIRFNVLVDGLDKFVFIGLLTYIIGFARVACNGDPFLVYSYTRGNGTFFMRNEALENPPTEQVINMRDLGDFWHVVIIRNGCNSNIVYDITYGLFGSYEVHASMGKVVKARKLREIGFTLGNYITDDDLVVYMGNKYCIISINDSQYSRRVPKELLLVRIDELLC